MDRARGETMGSERTAPPVQVRLIRPDEASRWAALMAAHHYLGFRVRSSSR
ncbi:MAG TPA: hypothetical protein VMW47_09120 [Verrucomicrobiae bacterium]|nr:hypothetical protein [Verrucomicrobiae bacterium]